MTKNTLTNEIEKMQSREEDKPRDYIGASIIGSDCLRQIWYAFKGTPEIAVPSKIRRTWKIGHALEGEVLDWLSDAGLEITRNWIDLSEKDMPFFRGHVDAVWLKKGEPFAIIEVKTARDSSYRIFANKGLFVWHPKYYAQIQSYMGMSHIHQAYIIVLNKDTSEISDELVIFDPSFYESLKQKALMISNAHIEPPKINGSPLWFQCKVCPFSKICHK